MPNPATVSIVPAPECRHDCARLSAPDGQTVVLLSGATVCNYCPAWRSETMLRQQEAFRVLAMSSRDVRRNHLSAREREFGPEYRRRLEAVILETWERRRASAAGDANG